MQPIPKFQIADPVQSEVLNRQQDAVRTAVNPILALAILNGLLLTNVTLLTGVPNPINHKLGRPFQGWWPVSPQTNAVVWQSGSQPAPQQQLVLECSADCVLSVWVF